MQIQAGTIIAGTLRDEDLLDAFSQELFLLHGCESSPVVCVYKREVNPPYTVDELIDALNEYAPDGMYFGALEGDGADFGWWYESEA